MEINQAYDFQTELVASHRVSSLPQWEEIYRAAFPGYIRSISRNEPGAHQKLGVDKILVVSNSPIAIPVDEKFRGRNRKTGKVYADILLEYLSDRKRGTPGWVVKRLAAHFIAYAIFPLGIAYIMPVKELQAAWKEHSDFWLRLYEKKDSLNTAWKTANVALPPEDLMAFVPATLKLHFTPREI